MSAVVLSAVGPMARDVDSLALCMKALLCEDMFALDPTVPPMPFDDKVLPRTELMEVSLKRTHYAFPVFPCSLVCYITFCAYIRIKFRTLMSTKGPLQGS